MDTSDLFAPNTQQLTVLSFGGGQDSSALLEMYLDNPEFRKIYAPNDFSVVMSDIGDEFDATYEHVKNVQERSRNAGVEFVFITSDMGFHSSSWLSLRHFYRTHDTIGSKSYPKTCSIRLKIQPIYRFLEYWLSKRYGVQCYNKKGIREFAAQYGKIKMMIGIAKGEEKRVSESSNSPLRWYRDSIETIYPLIDLEMGRQECQDYLHSKDLRVIPSNCKACPFLSLEELEYLRRFHAEDLDDWVELEAAKMRKHRDKEAVIVTDKEGNTRFDRNGHPKTANKNYGVFGVKALPEKIEEARIKFTDWPDQRISEYRYSHGHCVSTAY
jgi:3'-phosphoadenosine 5'-phosphosulfate sulfotransferase (PAPS reductase)/FAD synthetase